MTAYARLRWLLVALALGVRTVVSTGTLLLHALVVGAILAVVYVALAGGTP